jgi:hypothetical protein
MLSLLSTILFLAPIAQEPVECPVAQAAQTASAPACEQSCEQATVASAQKQCHVSEMDAALASLNQKLSERASGESSCSAHAEYSSVATATVVSNTECPIARIASTVSQISCPVAAAAKEHELVMLEIDTLVGGSCCATECEESVATIVAFEVEACDSASAAACETQCEMEAAASVVALEVSTQECASGSATACEEIVATTITVAGLEADGSGLCCEESAETIAVQLAGNDVVACETECCEEGASVETIVVSAPLVERQQLVQLRTEVASVQSAELEDRLASLEDRLVRIENMLNQLAQQL